MSRERVVFDTNVFISGLLSVRSPPVRAVEHAISHGQLVATRATVRELMTTLLSTKFDRYVSREQRNALLDHLAPLLEIVEVLQSVRASRDPRDDKFLEAAVNGQAEVIVSGDRDLFVLHPFRSIAIVRPADDIARTRS